MVIDDSLKLTFNNTSFITDGLIVPGKSTIAFCGDQPSTSIAGKIRPTFYQLVVNKAMGNVELNRNILVSHSLQMANGNLELNGYTLDLGNSGSIYNEHDGSLITGVKGGTVEVVADLFAPVNYNPGNIGIEISCVSNLGSTRIIRGHQSQINNGAQGIQRYFEIQPTYNKDQMIQVKFNYCASELAGNNESILNLMHMQSGKNDWINLGRDKADASLHWLLKDKVYASGRYTLSIGNGNLSNNIQRNFSVYPNPTPGEFVLSISSKVERDVVVRLLDIKGQVQQSRQIHVQNGITKVAWNITRFPAGTYLLSILSDGETQLKIARQ